MGSARLAFSVLAGLALFAVSGSAQAARDEL